jgi:hypothetical protein
LSQLVEREPRRTGYPVAAGAMIIASACLLIVAISVLRSEYYFRYYLFLSSLPNFGASIALSVVSLFGGVQALIRKRFLFVIFGTSFLIVQSLLNVTNVFDWLVSKLFPEEILMSGYPAVFIVISPVVLILSVLSLIFLTRSKHEFS